jgi:polar amino acid transport system substrate-binding protein
MNYPAIVPRPGTLTRLALAAALTLLASGVARAEDGGAAPAVPLCFTDFPPYVSMDLPDGGSLGALARRAFAAGGLKVQAIKTPWTRAFAMAKSGDCLILALWRNDERDALFRYSLPVARMQLGFFVRADRTAALPGDARVAFQRGSYLPAELAEGAYRLNPVVDMHPALQMLKLSRVDAVFSERASFEQLVSQETTAVAVRWVSPPLEMKTAYVAISKNHPQADAWLDLLNQEIRASVKN